jgi:hypothetical protein
VRSIVVEQIWRYAATVDGTMSGMSEWFAVPQPSAWETFGRHS